MNQNRQSSQSWPCLAEILYLSSANFFCYLSDFMTLPLVIKDLVFFPFCPSFLSSYAFVTALFTSLKTTTTAGRAAFYKKNKVHSLLIPRAI